MIDLLVQSLRKSSILSAVQHELVMPAVDGSMQASEALCMVTGATGEAVHNGRNRRKLKTAIKSGKYMARRRTPNDSTGTGNFDSLSEHDSIFIQTLQITSDKINCWIEKIENGMNEAKGADCPFQRP